MNDHEVWIVSMINLQIFELNNPQCSLEMSTFLNLKLPVRGTPAARSPDGKLMALKSWIVMA